MVMLRVVIVPVHYVWDCPPQPLRKPKPVLTPVAPMNHDKCPLRHRRTNPYIGCMRRFHECNRRSREGRNLTSQPPVPRHSSEGWNPGEDEGAAPPLSTREMIGNGRELKVLPLLATPDPATRDPNEATPGHCGPTLTSEQRAKRGHPGLIFSLSVRSKSGQTRPDGSKNQLSPLLRAPVGN